MAFPVQAQTTNICGRTQQVQDEILRQTPADDTCENVLESEMTKINTIILFEAGITSLKLGDFNGLTRLVGLSLANNDLAEIPGGIFSGLSVLSSLRLSGNSLESFPPNAFFGFIGLEASVTQLFLDDNPGAPFRFTVRFEPETLDENFDAAPVRVALHEGAPRKIIVPLSVTGPGGTLMVGSPSLLTISRGSTQSASVTVIRGQGYFRLEQGNLKLGGNDEDHIGYKIVQGPAITFGGVPVRVKVFLEGALE